MTEKVDYSDGVVGRMAIFLRRIFFVFVVCSCVLHAGDVGASGTIGYYTGIKAVSIYFDHLPDPAEEEQEGYKSVAIPPFYTLEDAESLSEQEMQYRAADHKARMEQIVYNALRKRLTRKTLQKLELHPAGTGLDFEWNGKTFYVHLEMGERAYVADGKNMRLLAIAVRTYKPNNYLENPFFTFAQNWNTATFFVSEESDKYYEDVEDAVFACLQNVSRILNSVYGDKNNE